MLGKFGPRRLPLLCWPGQGVEARASGLVRDLGMTFPLDLDEFCRKVGENRRRPLQVVAFNFPDPRIFGLWVECDAEDFIFHDANLAPRQRTRTILHEIGHMTLGHQLGAGGDDDVVRMVAPHLPPGVMRRRCLRRDCFESPQENDAEHFAAMLQYWNYRAVMVSKCSISGEPIMDAIDIF